MKAHPDSKLLIPPQILLRLRKEKAYLKSIERKEAERHRRRTKQAIDEMAKSTPTSRVAAAKARVACVYKQIDHHAAQADLAAAEPHVVVDLDDIRIDDLETLFRNREELPEWLRERIKKVHAKIHWTTRKGKKDYFNVAVHKNGIPIDKSLSIIAHLWRMPDDAELDLDNWVESVLECGLYPKIKRGKFEYKRRCQDGEHCELCNYLNISDGLKTLYAAYDAAAFNRGGNWFAFTLAPRTNRANSGAVSHTIVPADWEFENPNSMIYRGSHRGRIFGYPDPFEAEDYGDWPVETAIRQFLGAGQSVFGKLVKNGWLDGIRAKIENNIKFLPYTSHQHWHAVGSSLSEHDAQKMAEFVKAEVDTLLAQSCPGIYADVTVAVIPTPDDLRRWVKYMQKTVNIVEAVASVYDRFPGLRRTDCNFKRFFDELLLYPQRSRLVFKKIRLAPILGDHTYMLRRRYVRGNHKFGARSILTECERHRLWRENHAKTEANRRARAVK
ncbi:MAG: hypothetical protein JWR19_828 [Pedosphaera sp.]|nr:hypothetical protein [Pedosphaera sp.]